MATGTNFESGHSDMVHDAQLDYYGRRLATCSSDRTIKVFDIVGDQHTHLADLRGHEGPVWQVSWAHPKFGSLIASCSFDHKIIIWKETPDKQWVQAYMSPSSLHTASINSLCWAPHELGLHLAAASSDGTISTLTYQSDGSWLQNKMPGSHAIGATAVSWAPSVAPGALISGKAPESYVKRLVSSGCDNTVRVWHFNESTMAWKEERPLAGHNDWVRDVAWAPNLGLPKNTIASAGQDGQVFAWNETSAGEWERILIHDFKTPVWRVSWSTTGNILAVSDSSNAVTLWKETIDGVWTQVSH